MLKFSVLDLNEKAACRKREVLEKSQSFRRMEAFVSKLQQSIVAEASLFEKQAHAFRRYSWRKPSLVTKREGEHVALDAKDEFEQMDQGGGNYFVVEGGSFFEKAGVNVSSVAGKLSEDVAAALSKKALGFHACGISLIFHPRSPMIPSIHMNLRRLELSDGSAWYGGGLDLTPYYPFAEDFISFHKILYEASEKIRSGWYHEFKKNCDEYFYLPHRKEMRGIGGLFYDYKDGADEGYFQLAESLGHAFSRAYFSLAEKHKDRAYTPEQVHFQRVRRGRYVEFNLLYDRGTQFGLKNGGHVEAIFMSLPLHVSFPHAHVAEKGSFAETMTSYYQPIDWLNYKTKNIENTRYI